MPLLGKAITRTIQIRKKFEFKKGSPAQYQLKVIKRLLRNAKDTEFGTKYGFAEILKSHNIVKEFQTRVPIHDYNNMYNNWWNRCLEGNADVCWPGKVKYFALSSGTSEAASKYIPVTRDMMTAIKKSTLKLVLSMTNYGVHPDTFEKGVLMLGGSTELNFNGEYYEGDMSGISATKIPFWMNKFYKPGKKIAKTSDWEAKLEQIAKEAPNWDIGIICGIPSWIIIMLERVIERNNLNSIFDIWPNLALYVHGGIAFEPYRSSFASLFEGKVAFSETYMASEGFFGFKEGPDRKGMSLILNNGILYEFIPFNEENFNESGGIKADAKAVDIKEIEENVNYAILLSNCAGAWRYLLGDTIKFIDKKNFEFTITGRTKHFLSICGEHLSVDNMNAGVASTANELQLNMKEFTVQGVPSGNLFGHQWYIGVKESSPIDDETIAATLDKHLSMVNDDYRIERESVLHEIKVKTIPEELFFSYLKHIGKEGDMNKFPRVMHKDQYAQWVDYIEKNLTLNKQTI